jgi:hypothetical protein
MSNHMVVALTLRSFHAPSAQPLRAAFNLLVA